MALLYNVLEAVSLVATAWIGLRSSNADPLSFQWVTGETLNYTNWTFNRPFGRQVAYVYIDPFYDE